MIWIIIFSVGLAVAFGLVLAFASKKMDVSLPPLVSKIRDALPDKNCGGCGYANCEEYAKALAKDSSLVGKCVLADEKVNKKLSEITGADTDKVEKKKAKVFCSGGSTEKSEYRGIQSCHAALLLGNYKACPVGCLGFGDCIDACEYDALRIENGVAVVDEEKCVGCGKCMSKCPQGLIQLVPASQKTFVKCSSRESKKDKAKQCRKGCIGCGVCVKVCPVEAIELKDELAIIDYSKCTQCGLCAKKCPRGVIENNKNNKK